MNLQKVQLGNANLCLRCALVLPPNEIDGHMKHFSHFCYMGQSTLECRLCAFSLREGDVSKGTKDKLQEITKAFAEAMAEVGKNVAYSMAQ